MPFLLIDKPAGITSHDVVDRIRKITGQRTVGHAGTLDPFATGLLIVAVGRDSTKNLAKYVGLDKEYEAKIVLGATTDTLDPESPVIAMGSKDGQPITLSKKQILQAVAELTGDIEQIPPMHSAIKIKGKKLYELARQGKEIERQPRQVKVNLFKSLVELKETYVLHVLIPFCIQCSSGTYIRALARDLGQKLNTGGYLQALRRTKIGNFSLDQANSLEKLNKDSWIDRSQNDMLP